MRYYSKRFTVYYPGHWIQYQSCTHSAPSLLPGEHSGQVLLQGCTHATCNVRILPGTHLYTLVESSNVDKVSCWRTKSARHWQESNPKPFDPESRVQSNIPWHLHYTSFRQLRLLLIPSVSKKIANSILADLRWSISPTICSLNGCVKCWYHRQVSLSPLH